jgi:hypothetical protein
LPDIFRKLSARCKLFNKIVLPATLTFFFSCVNEFSKNIRLDHPDFVCGIMMGADAPMPPVAMSSAAPGGAPPRRIK